MRTTPRADWRSDDLIHERPEREAEEDRRIEDYLQRQDERRQREWEEAVAKGPCPDCGTNGPHYCPADLAQE